MLIPIYCMLRAVTNRLFDFREPQREDRTMTRGSLSIAFACALGGFIGTLAANDISTSQYGQYLWPVGALLGGIVAYIIVDFRYLCAGVARSYRQTIAWQPDTLWWKAWVASSLGGTAVFAWIFIPIIWEAYANDTPSYASSWAFVSDCAAFTLFLGIMCTIFGLFITIIVNKEGRREGMRQERLRILFLVGRTLLFSVNPFGLVYWTIWGTAWTVRHARWLITSAIGKSKAAAAIGALFVSRTFVYVHSERRTICLVDAAIGAGIGHLSLGNTAIGAVAGALLGLINHEIVSVRWLGIVPASR